MAISSGKILPPNRGGIYQADLAWIHHCGFGHFARNIAPELLRLLRRRGITRGRLIDLGCGSGLWAKAAQQAGFEVLGVDQSAAMIRLARQIAPKASFLCLSLHEFEFPACQVVTALGEPFNYLPPWSDVAGLRGLFERIATALAPGGLLIFDVMVAGPPRMSYRRWDAGEDWAALVEVSEHPKRRQLTREIISFRKRGTAHRRSRERHVLRLFTRAEIEDALRKTGFSCVAMRRYGRVKLLPRRWAFIARRTNTVA